MDLEMLVRKITAELLAGEKQESIPYLLDEQPALTAEFLRSPQLSDTCTMKPIAATLALQQFLWEKGYPEISHIEEEAASIDNAVILAVPIVSMNTVAKVSCGIADTPLTKILQTAFLKGKTVIFGLDGCLPEESSIAIPPPYFKMLVHHLQVLSSYGGVITPLKEFSRSVQRYLPLKEYPQEIQLSGNRITADDLLACPPGQRLLLAPQAQLTADAKIIAMQKEIVILQRVV